MQKKKMIGIFLVIALTMLALVGCGGGGSQQSSSGQATDTKPIELKFAIMHGSTHAVPQMILQPWADEVEKATDGRVKITIYPVDTLLKSNDIYEGVVSGIADIGTCDPGYNPGRFPMLSAFFLGGLEYANSKVASYVAWDLVKETELKETSDTKFMFVYGLQPSNIYSTKPVRTLEDLQGLQVRVTGFAADSIKALGAVPVGMPMNEAYEALLKGTIDANLAPAEVLEGWKHAEVTNSITKTPFINCVFHYITMNLDVWNSLPQDIQEKIEQVNRKIFEEKSTVFDEICNRGLEYAVNNYGHEVIELSEEEQARWKAKLEPLQEKWVKDMEAQGHTEARDVLERVKSLCDKYNEMYGEY